ncbi:hypothetical protein T459_22758 [Capsicum annuum]|uniref:C2 domain-containing protein n=1 Tax=Capsicum annuum TaxID=4072 RepID=A0A2G2YQF5_CAPAN|nr:hypothetical protein T459_22758 [Capsicum annuum]
MNNGKEKLVVEVVAAHNLMPKDGEGSSSPFVEVEFENQRLRTQVKLRDLNPVWNEKLVFHVNDIADLPYRTIEVNAFNEKRSNTSRNFLGRARISGSSIGRQGEEMAQLYTLDKRSLFSHVRGELSLKLYLSTTEEVKQVVSGNATAGGVVSSGNSNGNSSSKKNKKLQQQQQTNGTNMVVPMGQENKVILNFCHLLELLEKKKSSIYLLYHILTCPFTCVNFQNQNHTKPVEPVPGDIKPVVITTVPGSIIPAVSGGHAVGGGGGGGGGGISLYSSGQGEFSLKETSPHLGGKDKTSSTYDLVEQMQYLYVRVVKAKDFSFFGGGGELVAEVKLGNYRGITKRVVSNHAEWDQVFAFSKDSVQSSVVEIFVKENNKDDFLGRVWFDLNEVPKRVPPDSQLAPQWYRMEDKKGDKSKGGEVMVAIWFGTQADEAFAEAWHSKAANVHFHGLCSIKSEVYLSPKLCLSNPFWNEDLMFVVAEPFEEFLLVSIEDRLAPNREEVVGRVLLPVSSLERRLNEKPATSSSDVRPTAKQLWKPHIGVLEVGVLGVTNLVPMKMKEGKGGSVDAYCVAKYGQKWVRTRTVVDSLSPKWNEQYTWEVFDPCTVITIGVFDNSRVDKNMANPVAGNRDSRIGKVRIRLSTLEIDRVYTHAYPLLMLHPSGVKKMGEIHLAVRFSRANMINMLHMYTMPLLPKMHYVQPLSVSQLDSLRHQAMNVVATRLSRSEPPLGREVVEYMLDHDSHMWSMRKSKANFFRLTNVVSWFVIMSRFLDSARNWHKPVHSALALFAFTILVLVPELIIPCALLNLAAVGLWRYRSRPRHPPHMDTRLSYAESFYPDELDEEFDSFPTSRSAEIIRVRYDRLRSVAGRIQTVVGDMATQGERFQALLSWRDPRATFLFVIFCFFAALGFYLVPIKWVVALWGLYYLRPPRFRNSLPYSVVCFLKRLPTRADSMLCNI